MLYPFLALLTVPQKMPPPLTREWAIRAEKGLNLEAQLGAQHDPGGLRPLVDYARFYQRKKIRGHYLVEALYTRHDRRPGIYLAPAFSDIADGGCSVIHLTFDYATGRVLQASCNGVA